MHHPLQPRRAAALAVAPCAMLAAGGWMRVARGPVDLEALLGREACGLLAQNDSKAFCLCSIRLDALSTSGTETLYRVGLAQ